MVLGANHISAKMLCRKANMVDEGYRMKCEVDIVLCLFSLSSSNQSGVGGGSLLNRND